jgi:hypothetical protein
MHDSILPHALIMFYSNLSTHSHTHTHTINIKDILREILENHRSEDQDRLTGLSGESKSGQRKDDGGDGGFLWLDCPDIDDLSLTQLFREFRDLLLK